MDYWDNIKLNVMIEKVFKKISINKLFQIKFNNKSNKPYHLSKLFGSPHNKLLYINLYSFFKRL